MDPHSRAPKKNTSHGNEVLPQGTTRLIQRPCYQRESPCQDPAGNRTTRRPPDRCKELQTAVVWSCFPFIRSGQNQLARHSERGKKTRQTDVEVGRQHQGMNRPGVRQVPESSGEQGKMEKTGCKIICGAPMTLAVKELMMMMMNSKASQQPTRQSASQGCQLVRIPCYHRYLSQTKVILTIPHALSNHPFQPTKLPNNASQSHP